MTTISAGLLQNIVFGPSASDSSAAQAAKAAPRSPTMPTPSVPEQAMSSVAMSSVTLALRNAASRLASRQSGLAPLYPDLDVAVRRADLPPDVRAAAQSVLSLRMGSVRPDVLQAAVLKSGLFTEAMLAGGAMPADMKTALLSLRQTLQGWLGSSASETLTDPQLPPPYRGAPPTAQQPASASIAVLDPRAAGLRLLAETDGALARQTLLQIAALPDAIAPQQQSDTQLKLTMDIPLATPLGTAIIQLQVEQDGQRKDDEAGRERTWRINLAIDIEPLGPVRATVSQTGGLTHVALMAERKDSAQALRNDLPMLETSLAEAALDVGDVQCHTGKPHAPSAPAGQFLDRAS